MGIFKEKFLENKFQSQVFSLILVVIILTIMSIVIYVKSKNQKANKAPEGILYFAEQYVMGIENLYVQVTENKFKKPAPYIYTILTMIGLGNLVGLIGFEPVSSSYSFTLTLALIAWIGIYVVGIMYRKWAFFKKYLNPVEIIGQFAPLISLSFRMFGNIIGGVTIVYLIYQFTGWMWGMIPIIGEFNLLGPLVAPGFHFYFDIFSGIIQTFVFTLLTMIYWTIEAEPSKKEVASAKEIASDKEASTKIKTNQKG